MRIEIHWPDGSRIRAKTWREAEHAIRACQWSAYPTRMQFRTALARRAEIWSGVTVSRSARNGSSERFVKALARCKMFQLTVTDTGVQS